MVAEFVEVVERYMRDRYQYDSCVEQINESRARLEVLSQQYKTFGETLKKSQRELVSAIEELKEVY